MRYKTHKVVKSHYFFEKNEEKMNKKSKEVDIVKKYWDEYIKIDCYFTRREKLKELQFLKDLPTLLENIDKVPKENFEKIMEWLIVYQFQLYIDDLIRVKILERTYINKYKSNKKVVKNGKIYDKNKN